MGVVIKQSAYASIINYLGVVIGAINIIFLYPAFLSQNEFGLFKALFAMAIVIAPFAQFGLGRSIVRYFPRFNSSDKTKGRFLTLILILGAFSFSIFLLLFQLVDDWIFSFYTEKAPALIDQYWLIICLAFLLMYIAIIEAYYKALLNVVIPTFMREFFLRITSTLIVFLYYLKWIDFGQFLIGSVLTYVASLCCLIVILIIKRQFVLNFSIFKFNSSFIKELLRYMVFIMAGAVGTIIVLQIDQLMVTAILGVAENAIYVVAFFMASVIEIPRRAIAPMSDALIAKSFEFERIDEVKKIYKQSSINQLILGCFVFLLVILNLDNIYQIMPAGETYKSGATVVLLIGLSKLIDMGFGVNSEIIVSSKLYKVNIYFVLILAVLTVSLNIWLIPIYGLTGAAFASLLAVLIFNLLKLIFIWSYLKFQPFSLHTLSVIGITVCCYFIVQLLPLLENVYLNTLWVSAIISLSFLILMLLFKPSKEITTLLLALRKRLNR
ncbi:MAG: O-antigen/teichoic acid export membrane protein [Marivirga sp.]